MQTIIRNDKKKYFKFASLQSSFAQQFFKERQLNITAQTIVLWSKGRFFTQSSAVIHIAIHLRFPYPLLAIFYILPLFIRNALYNYIARNRYKWFGKQETCMVPTPELKNRFLE